MPAFTFTPPSDPSTASTRKPIKLSQLCEICHSRKALLRRPKDQRRICKLCFFHVFETEIHNTIISNNLFHRGERVAIGASGGKDSTVLAYVLKLLNERYDYGIDITLLSVDECIVGYRDDSLATVKRNQQQYNLPLEIVSFRELYNNWTMDDIVSVVGVRHSCTYCGIFRRQSLDRGAQKLGISHVVTGHNADDMAETVLMNILRGDVMRLAKSTAIVTQSGGSPIKRSKPFKYTYQKEIVLYAHYKKLDYFSTECTYAPEAFRGTARELIKQLEAVRPSCIIDIIHSGEDLAVRVAAATAKATTRTQRGKVENRDVDKESVTKYTEVDGNRCERCNYLSSNKVCQACLLLEGLEKSRATVQVEVEAVGNECESVDTDGKESSMSTVPTSTAGAGLLLRTLEKLTF